MTENERQEIMLLANTIDGEINRMCVTPDLVEFDTMYHHARNNIEHLAGKIYNYKFLKKKARRNNDTDK